jgi:hypothetical protein
LGDKRNEDSKLPLVAVKGNKFVDPNGKAISWPGWVFDPEWGPNLLQSWDTYELTGGGEFFQQALYGKIGG